MKVTCVACRSTFQLYKIDINVAGSLVKCAKCHFIFMTQITDFDELVSQDTNINQSILNDLFEMESALIVKAVMNQSSEKSNNCRADRISLIEDYAQEAFDSNTKDVDYVDLPDLSAFEEMIDWDEVPETEEITAIAAQNIFRAPDLDGDS